MSKPPVKIGRQITVVATARSRPNWCAAVMLKAGQFRTNYFTRQNEYDT